jgi:hypothetical protein
VGVPDHAVVQLPVAEGKFGDLFEFDFPNTGFVPGGGDAAAERALRAAVGTELQAGRYKIDARAPGFPAAAGLGGTGVFNVGDRPVVRDAGAVRDGHDPARRPLHAAAGRCA